jgi:acyl-coenzyme A thioesterase PaaI-like protein
MESYPPRRHLLRDLCVRVSRQGVLWSACAPVIPQVCGVDGTARASFLAALVDVAGGRTGAALARSGTVLTQEISLHVLRPVPAGEVCASVRVLRDGRSLIVYDVALAGEDGCPVARASMTSAKVARPASVDARAGRPGDWLELALPDSGLSAPLFDYAGLRPFGEDAVELDLAPQVANGLGILHGAAQLLAVEAAAERAARRATERALATTDLSLRYLEPGRKGPFRARAELLRQAEHGCLARVELVDLGESRALLAIGDVGLALA